MYSLLLFYGRSFEGIVLTVQISHFENSNFNWSQIWVAKFILFIIFFFLICSLFYFWNNELSNLSSSVMFFVSLLIYCTNQWSSEWSVGIKLRISNFLTILKWELRQNKKRNLPENYFAENFYLIFTWYESVTLQILHTSNFLWCQFINYGTFFSQRVSVFKSLFAFTNKLK